MKNSRPCWLLIAIVHGKPLSSDGHNFFVQTPFWMFLNYMERPFSIESINIYIYIYILIILELIFGPKIMKK